MRLRRAPLIVCAAFVAAACALAAPAALALQHMRETDVKAAFLVRFAPFVEWPRGAPAGDLKICVVGDDPFGARLDELAAGPASGARTMVVRRLPVIAADSPCHVAYLTGSPRQSVREGLRAVRGRPVLTITDAGYGEVRGVLHLEVVDNRVRFHADDRAAGEQGLRLSSKLLSLALSVRSRG